MEQMPWVQWHLSTAPGGWWRLREENSRSVVYVKVEPDAEGWPRVVEAAMRSDGPIRTISWRDIPFEAVESFARSAPWAQFEDEEIKAAEGQPDIADLEQRFGGGKSRGIPLMNFGGYRSIPELRALIAPAGHLTDEFLAKLAAAYTALATAKQPPAPAIAEQTGARVRTVHRWVAEARKRGHLPPGTQGRIG